MFSLVYLAICFLFPCCVKLFSRCCCYIRISFRDSMSRADKRTDWWEWFLDAYVFFKFKRCYLFSCSNVAFFFVVQLCINVFYVCYATRIAKVLYFELFTELVVYPLQQAYKFQLILTSIIVRFQEYMGLSIQKYLHFVRNKLLVHLKLSRWLITIWRVDSD